jgi:hypothetical protein
VSIEKQPDGNSGAFFCYARVWMQVEGVPEGWELVRIVDRPQIGEYALDRANHPIMVMEPDAWDLGVIVRKIEKPAQYRPFANAEEFKPHRDRWVRHIASDTCSSVIGYNDRSVKFGTNKGYWDYEMAFETWVFDDESPFGVEVA